MTQNAGYTYRHVLGADAAGRVTLDFLVKTFPHSSESQWRERLICGEILLGDRIADGTETLRAGTVLIWNRRSWLEEDTPQQFGIVFRDEYVLVVNKPSGLPTLPGAGFFLNTLLSMVRTQIPGARPLHRLGRATSGLVLFGLDACTTASLSRTWTLVQKQYQALAVGVASLDTYDIRCVIGQCDHPRLGKVYAACETGKSARSVARVLQRRANSTVFEVDLHTGRPHQIRIHLASIGHPLVGDPLYASGGQPIGDHPGLPGDSGYWLHAKRLAFEHPVTHECLDLAAPIPKILDSD